MAPKKTAALEPDGEGAIRSAIVEREGSAEILARLLRVETFARPRNNESVSSALRRLRARTSRNPFTLLELALIVNLYRGKCTQELIARELELNQPMVSRLLRLYERVLKHEGLRTAVFTGDVSATVIMEHTEASWRHALREFDETGRITPRFKTTSARTKTA